MRIYLEFEDSGVKPSKELSVYIPRDLTSITPDMAHSIGVLLGQQLAAYLTVWIADDMRAQGFMK